MPIYCYRVSGDERAVEITMTSAEKAQREAPDGTITLPDGRKARRDFLAEHRGFRSTCGTYPFWSDAAGVHPDQVPEEKMRLKRLTGYDVEFDSEGSLLMTSRDQRRAVLRASGLHDRNGGYSDP